MYTTLIVGASEKPERYSYKALHLLQKHGHEVQALSVKKARLNGVTFVQSFDQVRLPVHTITLYINPTLQVQYYEAIIAAKPVRVIFNPGTENAEFTALLQANEIQAIEACTLVMLNIGTF
jgi:hypothetical protein